MKKYKKQSNKQIYNIWCNNQINKKNIYDFQCELVKRGMTSWEEINKKYYINNYYKIK